MTDNPAYNDHDSDFPDLQTGDLLAYLEGEAPPALIHRIERDPAALAEAAALAQTEAFLSALYLRDACPDVETLLLYQADLLPPEAARTLEAHLTTCADCPQELDALAQLAPRTAPQPQAPSLADRLRDLGATIQAVLRPNTLQPDVQLRGTAAQELIYQADDYEIVLNIQPQPTFPNTPATWSIEGQILDSSGVPPASGSVELLAAAPDIAVVQQDMIDAAGFFALDHLPVGSYIVQINLGTTRLLIADIELE